MTWSELKKANDNALSIENEINRLLKSHNGLLKKEIVQHREQLIIEAEDVNKTVEELCKEMMKNLRDHRKQVESKAEFLKRHNKRI